MTKINLINKRFWSFQWNSSWLKGFNFNQSLPTEEFFFYSLENFYLLNKHIDMTFRYLKRKLKKSGSYQFVYPCDFPITKKPTEVWMGKGKGAITDWAIPIKKGLIFFKLTLTNPILINSIVKFFQSKFPFWLKYTFSKHIITELNSQLFNSKIKKLPIFETTLIKKWFTRGQN